ncbi:MAG: DUF2793 domain-containing protein [Pseudomonadota bacterium]
MDQTPNLRLPYIAAAQAQKHVTHNEAIRALDALVQLTVIDQRNDPPEVTAGDGDRYITGSSPTGAWASHPAHIAAWQDGAWTFLTPQEGWLAYSAAASDYLTFDGTQWATRLTDVNTSTLGINATADTTNRLAVSSPAILFTHDGDDQRVILNRASASDVASVQFQANYSADSEIAVSGDGSLAIKNKIGTALTETIAVHGGNGAISMPQQPAFQVNMGTGAQTITGMDTVVPFQLTVFDRTGAWKAASNAFVAPVPGIYLLRAGFFTFANTSEARLAFGVNGTADIGTVNLFYGATPVSMTHIIELQAGDQVDVRTSNGHNTMQVFGYHCTFSGAKIA